MEQRHKYEYNIDLNDTTAAAIVVRMVEKNKRVLELGAGPGSITRLLHSHRGCRVTAIEIDEEAIRKLSPFCERVHICDLNDRSWKTALSKDGKFEVVVAADVLEHLRDPWSLLKDIKGLLAGDGYVVVSLPHIGHNAVIACLLQEDWEYHDWGLLDKTHIRYFGMENIQRLFNDAGFKIVEAEFVVIPPEHTEFAAFWRHVPEEFKEHLRRNRFGTVYQVVVKAQPDASPRRGLKLSSIVVPGPSSAIYAPATFRLKIINLIKRMILPHMSPGVRSKLRDILYGFGIKS